MKKAFLITFIIFLSLLLRPISVSAVCEIKLVPCGGSYEPQCSICHVFALLHNIIEFILTCLFPIISVLMLVIGGMYILMVGVSPAQLQKGKEIVKGAVIGILVVFGAWVFINTVLIKMDVAQWTGLGTWWELYSYGSVSGIIFHDRNNDGSWGSGEEVLSGRQIVLSGDADRTQITDSTGYYSFADCLSGGNYTISLVLGPGEIQAFPTGGGPYSVTLSSGENLPGFDFGVYVLLCGNGIVDVGEKCDDGNTVPGDGCSPTCTVECDPCQTDDGAGGCITVLEDTNWGDNLYNCIGDNPGDPSDSTIPANSNARCVNGECRYCRMRWDPKVGIYKEVPDGYLYWDGCYGCAGQGGLACWRRPPITNKMSCTDVCNYRNGSSCLTVNGQQIQWKDPKCWVQCVLWNDAICRYPDWLSPGEDNCSIVQTFWDSPALPGLWSGSGYFTRRRDPNQDCGASDSDVERICICEY